MMRGQTIVTSLMPLVGTCHSSGLHWESKRHLAGSLYETRLGFGVGHIHEVDVVVGAGCGVVGTGVAVVVGVGPGIGGVGMEDRRCSWIRG